MMCWTSYVRSEGAEMDVLNKAGYSAYWLVEVNGPRTAPNAGLLHNDAWLGVPEQERVRTMLRRLPDPPAVGALVRHCAAPAFTAYNTSCRASR